MPANNLKKLRTSKGLTLTALSERSGISIAQIWNIENKPGTPRKATMAALAKSLGCRVSTVFPDTKPLNGFKTPEPIKETVRVATGDVATSLANVLRNRSPSELGRIVTMLEAAFPR